MKTKYIRCHDRMCGASDCPNCNPCNFKGGIYWEDLLCPECRHEMVEEGKEKCSKCENACPMCGNEVDDDTGVCFTCKEVVR